MTKNSVRSYSCGFLLFGCIPSYSRVSTCCPMRLKRP